MIPHYEVDIRQELPKHELLTPPLDDWDEGISPSHFAETWPLVNLSRAYASEILERETEALTIIDRAAPDIETFERLAGTIESGYDDDHPSSVSDSDWDALARVSSDVPGFDGLELGTAGLVTVLGALDCIPLGSCRGHPDPCNWENHPMVLFLSDLRRAQLVEEFARMHRCGLEQDENGYLQIWAPSVVNVHSLAIDLLANADRFDQLGPADYIPRGPLDAFD